jgi:hypothetical protein
MLVDTFTNPGDQQTDYDTVGAHVVIIVVTSTMVGRGRSRFWERYSGRNNMTGQITPAATFVTQLGSSYQHQSRLNLDGLDYDNPVGALNHAKTFSQSLVLGRLRYCYRDPCLRRLSDARPGRRGAVFQMGADAGGNSEQDSYTMFEGDP